MATFGEDDDVVALSQLAHHARGSGHLEHDFSNESHSSEPEDEEPAQQPAQQPAQPSNGGFHLQPFAASMEAVALAQAAAPVCNKKSKTFNDPVHGHIRLDHHFVKFIDTRPFQRLRYLNQLGLTFYVFPGASHTRFEHSLGVCYKAFQFADQIWAGQGRQGKRGGGSLDMHKRDLLTVGLAGLCHDLGHGPFSHVWDYEFLRVKGIKDWTHEGMSCSLVDYIRDTYHLDCITDDEARWVKLLIQGDRPNAPAPERGFLFDIVANSRNGLDVDKADYLARDAMHCGVKVSCDFDRLMRYSKVLNNQIAYKWSEYHNIMELFHSRSIMHRRVYTHRKAKAIELMVVDALLEADSALGFSKDIHDPARFIKLDDTLLRRIEEYEDCYPHLVAEGAAAPLAAARKVADRIRNRELYRYVNELLVPAELEGSWRAPTSQELCSYWHANGAVQLDPEQVCVNVNTINWAMKNKNPLDNVSWFTDFSDTQCAPRQTRHMTSMITPVFQETKLRVYSKVRDPKVVAALDQALEAYCRKQFGSNVVLATPCKAGAVQPTDFTGIRGAAVQGIAPWTLAQSLNESVGANGGGELVEAGRAGKRRRGAAGSPQGH